MTVNFIDKTQKGYYWTNCFVLVAFAIVYIVTVIWWWYINMGASNSETTELLRIVRKVYMTGLLVVPTIMILLLLLSDVLPVNNITKHFVSKSRYAAWLYKTYGSKCKLLLEGNNMIYGVGKNKVTLVTNVNQVDDLDKATLVVEGTKTTLLLPRNGVIILSTEERKTYEEVN